MKSSVFFFSMFNEISFIYSCFWKWESKVEKNIPCSVRREHTRDTDNGGKNIHFVCGMRYECLTALTVWIYHHERKKKRIKDHHSMEITSCCFLAPLHFYWKIKVKSHLIFGFLVSLKMKHLTLSLVQWRPQTAQLKSLKIFLFDSWHWE